MNNYNHPFYADAIIQSLDDHNTDFANKNSDLLTLPSATRGIALP